MRHTVRQVAERVGLPDRTVRYYDRIGLVSPGKRSPAGYRLYGPEDEVKLRFVRQAKALGFSLTEIHELLTTAESGSVRELDRLLGERIAQVDAHIVELRSTGGELIAHRGEREEAEGSARPTGSQVSEDDRQASTDVRT